MCTYIRQAALLTIQTSSAARRLALGKQFFLSLSHTCAFCLFADFPIARVLVYAARFRHRVRAEGMDACDPNSRYIYLRYTYAHVFKYTCVEV